MNIQILKELKPYSLFELEKICSMSMKMKLEIF